MSANLRKESLKLLVLSLDSETDKNTIVNWFLGLCSIFPIDVPSCSIFDKFIVL